MAIAPMLKVNPSTWKQSQLLLHISQPCHRFPIPGNLCSINFTKLSKTEPITTVRYCGNSKSATATKTKRKFFVINSKPRRRHYRRRRGNGCGASEPSSIIPTTSTMFEAVYNAITKALNHSVVRVVLGFLITTVIFGHRPPPYSPPAGGGGLTFHCGFYSDPPLSSSPFPSASSAAVQASSLSTSGATNVCQENFVRRTPVDARVCWCRCHDKVDFGVSEICVVVANVLILLGILGICLYYSATPDERQRFLPELLDDLSCVVQSVKENGWIRTLEGGCTTEHGGRKETLQENLIKKLDKFDKATHVNVNNLAIKSIATKRLNESRDEYRVADVKMSMEEPKEPYHEIFIEEMEKFDEVTNANGNNMEIKNIATGKANESCDQYRVATILVDAAEVHELSIINGFGDLENIFRKLQCISPSQRQILTKLFSLHDGGDLEGTLERPHSSSSSSTIQGVLVLWAANRNNKLS